MTETTHLESIVIDEGRTKLLAQALGRLTLASDFASQMTPVVQADDETVFRAYLWAAAICHATKGGLSGYFSGEYYKGWDFLLRAFSLHASQAPHELDPSVVSHMTEDRLVTLLTACSTRAEVGLRDLDRRAEILRETATELSREFGGSVTELLKMAGNTVGGENGAYALLERLSAFRDPLHKKSSAFLMTVHFSGRWQISDDENILPMIDYHRMRILMRTGCLEIHDEDLAERLRNQEEVEASAEAAIREASMRICALLPRLASMPMFDFDVLLWAHARSCCRHAPVCVSRRLENASFSSYLASPPTDRCVFESWCPGAENAQVRSFWEPIVTTEDY